MNSMGRVYFGAPPDATAARRARSPKLALFSPEEAARHIIRISSLNPPTAVYYGYNTTTKRGGL